MGKMWIRQVKAIRNDGNASTIDLQQGLNCIIGPSNTGKTGIAKTISFVCGGNVIPFTDVTGYAGASVTFSTEHGEVTLQRSLASQTIQVSRLTQMWNREIIRSHAEAKTNDQSTRYC